jgi:hypothetical protein
MTTADVKGVIDLIKVDWSNGRASTAAQPDLVSERCWGPAPPAICAVNFTDSLQSGGARGPAKFATLG